MTPYALAITYHAVDARGAPLSVDPSMLRDQLDCIADSGVPTLTVAELAAALRDRTLPARAAVLTFDDAFASVVQHAAPLLAERGQRATVFAVAGAIGGSNDWPTQPAGAHRAPLADLEGLRSLARAGWEIGSHGVEHAPLSRVSADTAHRELVESRARLEDALGVEVSSYALPYGDLPASATARLLRSTYQAVCTTRLGYATPATDRWAIPRVDAHYLRRVERLRHALEGYAGLYLRARGVAARARRVVHKDYAEASG